MSFVPDPASAARGSRQEYVRELPLIKVVGVSAAGKSTLVKGLRALGYNARPVSQEHSYLPTLWNQFDHPAVLIFLDVSLEAKRSRRPDVDWSAAWHATELERLHNARGAADLQIDTSRMTPEQVLNVALLYLRHERVRHGGEALPPVGETGSARPRHP